jgi:ligand-binding sensor domain-containing protein
MKNIFSTAIILFAIFFASCEKDPDEPEEIFTGVTGFVISPQGVKYLATDKGLYTFEATSSEFKRVRTGIQLAPLNDLVYSLITEKELWIGSDEGALNFNSQLHLKESNSGLDNNVVTHLNFDYAGRSYFATPTGISILENESWTTSTGLDDLYLFHEITGIASARNGYTYITTHGGGVECFKSDIDGISGATIYDTDWTRLESNNILTVFIDDTTQVFGTDRGVALHFSELTKWDWEAYTSAEGLINDTVISIVKDQSDNWWFGTTNGLSKFNDSEWTNYSSENNNMHSNHIKFLAVDIDGSVWFASDEGLSQFKNEQWLNFPKNK